MTPILMFLIQVLLVLMIIAGIFATVIGLLTLVQFARSKKLPMDESNRINHIRLWWFVLTRPELFVNSFPWLKNDELDNTKNDQ
jgi:heme/copper-type cytochrome/quinol oxidase subunit 2